MKTLKLTAKNKFHNRETTVIAKGDRRFFISRRQYQRYWRRVCGVSGCLCSTTLTDKDGSEYVAASANGLANPDYYEILKA